MDRYVAHEMFVAAIRDAVVRNNPNDPSEEYDEEAIKDLANYAEATVLIEGPYDDGIIIDPFLDPTHQECRAYFLYDMLKWTRANNN